MSRVLSAERHELARDASYELGLLADLLRKQVERNNSGGELEPVARGILSRILVLNDVVFESVIQDLDDAEPVGELQAKLGVKV